jgi:ketosteroid isomerase-like protein
MLRISSYKIEAHNEVRDMSESGSGARQLTAEERRNVATAYEQMAAAMAGWRDAAEGRKRLEAIQSEDLAWFTPSSNPNRELHQGREEYIRLVTEFQFDHYIPGSKVEIFATTAQGNRVATEMISDIVLKDGTPYTNRYQQLFTFTPAGKVEVYKLYMDTAIFIRDDNRATAKIADDFLYALSTGGNLGIDYLLTDEATWTFTNLGCRPILMNKEAALKRIDRLQERLRGYGFKPLAGSAVVNGPYVAVRANLAAAEALDRKPVTTEHHFVIKTERPQESSHAGRILGGKIVSVREYIRGGSLPEV